MRDPILRQELAQRGVFFPSNAVMGFDNREDKAQVARYQAMRHDYRIALDAFPHLGAQVAAMDAQPGLATTPNAGVLLSSVSVIDPEVVRVLFTPMRAAEIMGGEAQKGTWIDQVAYFPLAEVTGQIASYGDYSTAGSVDANANWNYRQPYHWQAHKRYGEKQLEQWGAAGLNYASELDMGIALTFGKFSNKTSFYGVSGLVNYGLLNDPSLPSAVSPTTKADTSAGVTWSKATAVEQFNDIKKLYTTLVSQMGGNVEMTDVMTLVISTTRQPELLKANDFNTTTIQLIQQSFPNLTIKAAPEYSTGSGELLQLILGTVDGVKTAYPAYTEKLRTHTLVPEGSSWSQKVSAGSWGAIIRRPIAVAQMLGI